MKKIEIQNLTFDYPLLEKAFNNLKNITRPQKTNIGGKIIFDNKKKYLRAIDKVNLQINKGDKIALLGHNGSGKTTLLSILSGVYPIDENLIKINGSIQSFVSPHTGIDVEANCLENLKLILKLRGSNIEIKDKFIKDALITIGLGDYIYFPVKFLSTGMITRLSLFALEYIEKDILLLDEWISTIDKNFDLFGKKNFLLEKNLTLVFATHSERLAKKYCNKFVVLEKGSIVDECNIEQVSEKYFSKK